MSLRFLALALCLLRAVAVAEPAASPLTLLELDVEEAVFARQFSTSRPFTVINTFTGSTASTSMTTSETASSNIATVPSSSSSESLSITRNGTALLNTTTAAPTGTYTAIFAANGGTYIVTSESGYAVVAGHTLSAGGAGALVGGVVVTEASGGFVANGATIPFAMVMPSSTMSSSITTLTGSSSSTGAGAMTGSSTSPSHGAAAMKTAAPVIGAAVAAVMGLVVL